MLVIALVPRNYRQGGDNCNYGTSKCVTIYSGTRHHYSEMPLKWYHGSGHYSGSAIVTAIAAYRLSRVHHYG